MKLELLFQHPEALPTAPKVVQELISSFQNENVSTSDIAKKLALDPVLSAKLLRLVNTAFYSSRRSISTVEDAVSMLGFATVRKLVVSSSLANVFKSTPRFDMKIFWRYSMHTAVAAAWLARKVGQDAEVAFTIGMTHAIGQLFMRVVVPGDAMDFDKLAGPYDARRFEVERNAFGYDYATVGSELAKQWKFPATFHTTILSFPRPLDDASFNPLAGIIHFAVWVARADVNAWSAEEIAASVPAAVLARLGLEAQAVLDEMPPLSQLSAGYEELVG